MTEESIPTPQQVSGREAPEHVPTAVVYCEANFGAPDGKTANGLVRSSESYSIRAILNSEQAGMDAGTVLDGVPNGIPICKDLAEAMVALGGVPDCLIYGMAPASGMLSPQERNILLKAIALGIDVVSGLHEFLSDDPVFVAASAAAGVNVRDVRKPAAKKDLRMFSGRISEVSCPRIAVLGTDGAVGKRTTATILTRALKERGLKAVLVSTGQTGLMQGGRHGVALDALPSQFCTGELEAVVVEAFEQEQPDVIVVEGQGALSHPAYLSSVFILRGSRPHAVILQHAPGRSHLGDYPSEPMPTPLDEIELIETFADTRVVGLTLNHENMTADDVRAAILLYGCELGIPVTDALTHSSDCLIEMVAEAFPELREKLLPRGA